VGKPSAKTTPKPPAPRRSRWWLQLVAIALFCGAMATIAVLMRGYVDRKIAVQTAPPRVVLKNQPHWMSDDLVRQIIKGIQPTEARSTFDHQLVVETAEKLKTNPWVEKVNLVRRGFQKTAGDTLEVDVDYRVPAAVVRWGNVYYLVDNKGVKLPDEYENASVKSIVHGKDGKVVLRLIEGAFTPPPDAGLPWKGDDLAAGLAMVKLLAEQPFAQDVIAVNVENFARRKSPKEAQLVLKTRYGTEVRWGRPINASDFFIEVSTEQKLASLRQIYQQFGRVDAKQPWLDIRFDKITYPAPQQPEARAN
jgi:hypothetical protein